MSNNNESSSAASFSLQVIFGPDDVTTIKNVSNEDTVAHVMVKVIEERQNGRALPPNAELQLTFRGELLEDVFLTVSALGITEKDSLQGQIITLAPCSDIEPGV